MSSYNWIGVIDFLQTHFEKASLEQTEWALEKQLLGKKVTQLEAQVSTGEVVNIDLMKRIQILERCLRQQRRAHNSQSVDLQVKMAAVQDGLRTEKVKDQNIVFLERILNQAGISPSQIYSSQKMGQSMSRSQQQADQELFGHLDEVRGIYYEPKTKSLVSVSEDCLIKVWDTNGLRQKQRMVQSQLTIRENTGQLLTITGTKQNDPNSLVFTGGVEGLIKAWDPSIEAGKTSSCFRGEWVNYQDQSSETAIWDLSYQNNLLLASSGCELRLYQLSYEYKQSEVAKVAQNLAHTFTLKNPQTSLLQCPTSVCWIDSVTFANGYSNSNVLTTWDVNSGQHLATFKYQVQLKPNSIQTQTNKVLSNGPLNLLISAHEDGFVRAFDPGTNKLVKSLSHQDGVSCMVFPQNRPWTLFTGGHDGIIRVWDLRKNQIVRQIKQSHLKKYDQCINSIVVVEEKSILVSGGADSLIKIFPY